MLVLSRKQGETISIGHNVEVVVLAIYGNAVRLGVEAPQSVAVHRGEVYREIHDESKLSSGGKND